MADLILGNTTVMTESAGTIALSSGILSNSTFPTGHIIQTKTNVNNSTITVSAGTSSSPSFIDAVSVDITPNSGTQCIVFVDTLAGASSSGYIIVRLVRSDGAITVLDVNSDFGSGMHVHNLYASETDFGVPYQRVAVDTHGANGSTQITYKLQCARQNSGHNPFLGRTWNSPQTGTGSYHRGSQATRILVMELAS